MEVSISSQMKEQIGKKTATVTVYLCALVDKSESMRWESKLVKKIVDIYVDIYWAGRRRTTIVSSMADILLR